MPRLPSAAMNEVYIALKERLHEARCREIKANRLANEAACIAQEAEKNYAWHCWEVRDLEKQLQILKEAVESGI